MIHTFLPHYPTQLFPPEASARAGEIDEIFAAWCGVLFLLVAPVFIFMAYCAFKYRAGRPADRSHRKRRDLKIEMSWMITPFIISLFFFFWAGDVYLREQYPPPDATVITAIGRQWMWKFQHPGGQWEINDLHVPVNQPIRINIMSQDVVHSLYIPALREQEEAVPGRVTHMWFNADHTGAYRLYCSELCGADHALMAGTLYVMTPAAYATWLLEAGNSQTLASSGKRIFDGYGCAGCHGADGTGSNIAPPLIGVYGHVVPLSNGKTVVADSAYIRDSILMPGKDVVAGYSPIMPSFAGKISSADLAQLVAYIKSLGGETREAP